VKTALAQHTPGPWKQAIGPKFGETDIMALHSVTAIATVYTGVNGTDGNANARLIAAGPEMLEALKGLLANAPPPKRIKDDFSYILYLEAARTAIAKAEGRAE
jgi:hypothetical protein